jgi:hypothetical protein
MIGQRPARDFRYEPDAERLHDGGLDFDSMNLVRGENSVSMLPGADICGRINNFEPNVDDNDNDECVNEPSRSYVP